MDKLPSYNHINMTLHFDYFSKWSVYITSSSTDNRGATDTDPDTGDDLTTTEFDTNSESTASTGTVFDTIILVWPVTSRNWIYPNVLKYWDT